MIAAFAAVTIYLPNLQRHRARAGFGPRLALRRAGQGRPDVRETRKMPRKLDIKVSRSRSNHFLKLILLT
jgi:hypothetical protein